jgi:hypothetical protein
MGWDVGHENMGADGVSSWMLAVEDKDYPWGDIADAEDLRSFAFQTLIQVVRDPWTALPSIVLENRCAPERRSLAFRRRHIAAELGLELDDIYADEAQPTLEQELELAAHTYLAWHRICVQRRPTLTLVIEGDLAVLAPFNRTGWDTAAAGELPRNANKPYQGVVQRKPLTTMTAAEIDRLGPELRGALLELRRQYGYA